MNIALINNNVCENVAVFESLSRAQDMLGDLYDQVIECLPERGIGHRYISGVWYRPQPEKDVYGVYQYAQDMCVHMGDYVYGLDGKIYEALFDIQYQQQAPEDLPESYTLKL